MSQTFDTPPSIPSRFARAVGVVDRASLMALWVLFFAAAVLLAATLSCLPRFYFSVSISTGLAITLPSVLLAAAALTIPMRSNMPGCATRVAILALAAASICFAWLALYHPAVEGLVSVGGGDNGNHIYIARDFAARSPERYAGFTGVHASLHWASSLLRGDMLRATTWVVYTTVFAWCIAGVALLVLVPVRVGDGRLCAAARLAAGVLVWFYALDTVVLPFASYLQAEGFLSQLFSLISVAVLVLAYVVARPWWLRLLLVAFACAVCRATYGLNLADYACALALAFAVEAVQRGGRMRRIAFAAAALACAAAAALVFKRLAQLESMKGSAAAIERGAAIHYLLLMLVPAVAAFAWSSGSDRTRRLATLIVGVALSTLLVVACFALDTESERGYFLRKYPYLPIILLATTAPVFIVAVASRAAQLAARGRSALSTAALCTAIVAGASAIWSGGVLTAGLPWQFATAYDGRVDPRLAHVTPLADRYVLGRSRAIARRAGLPLRGISHASWPVHNFMNAAAADWERVPTPTQQSLDYQQGFLPTPGSCVTWALTPQGLRLFPPKAAATIAALEQNPDHECERYSPTYARGSDDYQLCWLCIPVEEAPSR